MSSGISRFITLDTQGIYLRGSPDREISIIYGYNDDDVLFIKQYYELKKENAELRKEKLDLETQIKIIEK